MEYFAVVMRRTIDNHIDQNNKFDIVPTIRYRGYYLLNI